jgi:predicted nucleotidyltransferase
MGGAGLDWIERLPAELDGQRAILERLLRFCERDDHVAWLVIGCSLARGAADRLSDLDLAMGVSDEVFEDVTASVHQAVNELGDLVESYQHRLPGLTTAHRRIFAQFADGCQVDLVVFPASVPGGSVPDVVVLYDPGDLLVTPAERGQATPEQVREWAFRGWCALADLAKYLRRRSPWEALDRLHEARRQLWQLWAVARGVPQPQYGLTSLLDFSAGPLPAGMDDTVADLDPARLLGAARRLAALLGEIGEHLRDDQRAVLPAAMARYVTAELEAIAAAGNTQTGSAQ